jgi:hypothetical protein
LIRMLRVRGRWRAVLTYVRKTFKFSSFVLG